jgi:type IV pilus assembly protein PilB
MMAAPGQIVPIGQMLLNENRISSDQLQKAIEEQKNRGMRLGSCLLRLGFASEQDINEMLQRQFTVRAGQTVGRSDS